MRKLLTLYILVLCLISCYGNAQVNKKVRDSLSALLINHPAKDTQRISLLNRYARVSRHDNPDTAWTLMNEGLSIAKDLRSDRWIARLMATKSMIFSKKDLYDSCIHYGKIAAEMLENENLYTETLVILNLIAENYWTKGKYAQTADTYYKVITVAERENKMSELGAAFGGLGNLYSSFNIFPKALENYQKALKIFRQTNDSVLIGAALTNIGLLYNNTENPDTAQKVLEEALHIFIKLKRDDILPDVKTALAYTLTNKGKTYEALEMLTSSMNESLKTNNRFGIANAALILAKTEKKIGDNTGVSLHFNKGIEYAKLSLNTSSEINEVVLNYKSLDEIAQLSQRLGNYKDAYYYQQQYYKIRDSIIGEQRRQEIILRESEFKNAARESVLKAAHETTIARQKNSRNIIILVCTSVFLIASLSFLFYKKQQNNKIQRLQSDLKAEISQVEMKALRARLNPHFIFNCLTSIADYVTRNKTNEARDYLTKFAKLMRLTLEHSTYSEISLTSEIEALTTYIELETLRMDYKPEWDIYIDKNINTDNTFIPPLLLQPFIENCFKHAFPTSGKHNHFRISFYENSNQLICTIEDNGVGVNSFKTKTHPSYGLSLTKSRLEILSKQLKKTAAFSFVEVSQGTKVEIIIPL